MKISFLSHNLSNNALGRAYILAKMLSKKYEVEILGPKLGKDIWEPVANDKEIKYIILSNTVGKIKEDLHKINGDIIYAVKPRGASYGYALLKKLFRGLPVILDEDDWDFGIFLDRAKGNLIKALLYEDLLNINNAIYTYFLGLLSFLANDITVSSTFLKRKFGGTIIPHARDATLYKVDIGKVDKLIKKYNLKGKKVIMFYGTVRMHKGLDTITKAIDNLKRSDIVFIIVGVNKELQDFVPKRKYVITIPPQKFEKISQYLSLADLVVLPQKKSHSSLGQVPAKIFDAMAMGKPIIASNISDIPMILENCGLTFEPENIEELTKKIDYLLNNPSVAKKFGENAKQKFLKYYTFAAVESKLFKIVDKYNITR